MVGCLAGMVGVMVVGMVGAMVKVRLEHLLEEEERRSESM